jgi:hypothetical protein
MLASQAMQASRNFLLFAIIGVACSRSTSEPDVVGNSASIARGQGHVTLPKVSEAASLCARLPKLQAQVFAAAWANKLGPSLFGQRLDESNTDPSRFAALNTVEGVPEVPQGLGQCRQANAGAWVMLVDRVKREEDDLKGTWALAHVDERGQLAAKELSVTEYPMGCWPSKDARIPQTQPGDFSVDESERQQFQTHHAVFDWDGDGVPELFLNVSLALSAADVSAGCIWTYRDGRVQPFEPARNLNIVRTRDVDGDGRDDLEVSIGGGRYLPRGGYRQVECSTLTLIAHSLPNGSFSLTDQVAVEYARRSCKTPSDALSTHVDVLCARVSGMNVASIMRAIDRGCAKAKPDSECDDVAAMKRLATAEAVPVLLAGAR